MLLGTNLVYSQCFEIRLSLFYFSPTSFNMHHI